MMSCLSDPWWLHSSGNRTSLPYNFFLAIRNVGNGRGWFYQPTFIRKTPVYLSHNRLLLQIGWSYLHEGGRHLTWSSSLNMTWSTALACHDGLFTIMGLSSSVMHFRDFATSLESRVYFQWHITLLLTALQKLSIRPLGNFSRNSSRKATPLGW